MKRRLAALLALALLLAACSAVPTEAPVSEATPSAAPTETPKAETASPRPTPERTPEPTPEPTSTPEPTPFTIAWIADTQQYAYSNTDVLATAVDAIIAKKDAENIVAVWQSGDLVENNAVDAEWESIRTIFAPLNGVLPFYCVAGNHDLGVGVSAYNIHEPGYDRYLACALCDVRDEAHTLDGGKCWYRYCEEGPFLLVGIGFQMNEDAEAYRRWIDEVLNRYADVPAIILTHSFLYKNGIPSGGDKNEIERTVVRTHPNVRLLLCGHHLGVKLWQKTYEEDRVVNAVMFNLQETENALGYIMLVTFDPVKRTVSFRSYSPYLNDYCFYEDETIETFVLENAF